MKRTLQTWQVVSPSLLLQSFSSVSAINPLVAFYDIHGGKREVLFFYFVPDTTRDLAIRNTADFSILMLIEPKRWKTSEVRLQSRRWINVHVITHLRGCVFRLGFDKSRLISFEFETPQPTIWKIDLALILSLEIGNQTSHFLLTSVGPVWLRRVFRRQIFYF
jgi:hypothetical protein